MTGRGRLEVEAHDETADEGVDLARWQEVARSTLALELAGDGGEEADGRLDLIFVDPDAMAELNREHMGADYATDVLAFPLDGAGGDDWPELVFPADAGDAAEHPGGPPARHLGDVVVCPGVARAQAPDHCGHEEAELTLLVVHGVLHVLGHDHAEDDERVVMQGRERLHLGRYGFEHPVPAEPVPTPLR